MRRFKVKVNDEVYEVEVEEVSRGEARVARPVVEAPPVQVSKPVAAPPVQKPAPSQSPAPVAPAQEAPSADAVRAPIPGVISAVKVSSGNQVKKGQVLLILEAMKMQNEILAPFDATVTGVSVSQGASVQTGDVLITLAR